MNIKDKDNRGMRIDQQEWLVLQVVLHIEELMEQKNVSRSELSKRLGTNKSYITELLDGANMTLRKVADVLFALDSSLVIDTCNLAFETTISPVARPYVSSVSRPNATWEVSKPLYGVYANIKPRTGDLRKAM